MTLLKAILCFALASVVYSHGTEHDHTADCRKAESLFYSLCSPDPITLQTIQGTPGKRGAPGPKGDAVVGAQGPPGVVDYDRVDSIIEQRLEQVFSDQNEKIAQLEAKLREMKQKEGFCDIKYNGKCFWVEVNYKMVRCDQRERICGARGGSPANVYSEEHYEMIKTFLRKQILSTESVLYVLSGMRINVSTMTSSLLDGTPSPFLKWHSGYPKTDTGREYILIQVRSPWNAASQEMYNALATDTAQGVLCEKK